MRFQKRDMIGILFAMTAPMLAMWLVLSAFDLWNFHDTPMLGALLGGVAVNIAIGAGILGAFSRFIKSWDWIGGLGITLFAAIALVVVLQRVGHGSGLPANLVKILCVFLFLGLNINIIVQLVRNGVDPWLLRKSSAPSK
jgi:hypothetical protein|tara:strand:- start:2156 stop:2575 length:420 start_codon:yes stop_codon:yes gene_type:complete